MEIELEEKKKEAHKIIDELQDDKFLDKIIALYELESIKTDRDPSNAISGEEMITRLKQRIEGWWGT